MNSEQFYPGPGAGQVPAHGQPLAAARPGSSIPARKLIIAAVIAALLIAAAVIGHAVASGSSIAAGDCVVTNPTVLSGWDIKKVACNSDPGSSLVVQKVESVQSGSSGACDPGLTTFQDQPANMTYCLSDSSIGAGG